MASHSLNQTATPKGLSPTELEDLRETLKRCSPEVFESAVKFRQTGDTQYLSVVVLGIIERYLEPELRPRLQGESDQLELVNDLGIDSLTMVEIVILVEEAVKVSIDNDELRGLITLSDVKQFIECKVKGITPPQRIRRISQEEILLGMPQKPPFLFLSEAYLHQDHITGKYLIRGDEGFLAGHFPDNPVFPASLLLEALGQLGVLYLLEKSYEEGNRKINPNSIYFTSSESVRCQRICRPGDTLEMTIRPKRMKHPLATFEGGIKVNGEKAAFAEEITLTFDYDSEDDQQGANSHSPAKGTDSSSEA